ncbi:MAG: ion transporter [Neomegalonema sp.]|nr:ion transporter [Neomegalonema sp.]
MRAMIEKWAVQALEFVQRCAGRAVERALGGERAAQLRHQIGAHVEWAQVAAKRVVEDRRFERSVIGAILLNAVLLGLTATPSVMRAFGGMIHLIDALILAFFTVEILLRLIAYGRGFFRSGWSWFDLIAVSASYIPNAGGVAILRTLRLFRVLRLLSVVPAMRRVIGSFFTALPSMAGVVGALGVIFYVSAVITTTVFGQASPADFTVAPKPEDLRLMEELYGTLGRSFFTLFQLMTLENWVDGIVGPTMRVFPSSFFFFGPYIVLTSFAILNLFIGVIVEAMATDRDEAEEKRDEAQNQTLDELLTEVRALGAEAGRSSGQRAETAELLSELRALRAEVADAKAAAEALRRESGNGWGPKG